MKITKKKENNYNYVIKHFAEMASCILTKLSRL